MRRGLGFALGIWLLLSLGLKIWRYNQLYVPEGSEAVTLVKFIESDGWAQARNQQRQGRFAFTKEGCAGPLTLMLIGLGGAGELSLIDSEFGSGVVYFQSGGPVSHPSGLQGSLGRLTAALKVFYQPAAANISPTFALSPPPGGAHDRCLGPSLSEWQQFLKQLAGRPPLRRASSTGFKFRD